MNSIDNRASTRATVTADAILEALDSAGLRNTRPRRVIAEQLAEYAARGTAFGTDELWQALQRGYPHLGRATLFRSVDVLADLGVLDRIELGDGTRRYRVCDSGHHHHLICIGCHRIEEVEVCLPEQELRDAAAGAGFDVERHALELYGRCADCRRRDA
jgi:Fe2+ or Zn2+ uptake regulation protein